MNQSYVRTYIIDALSMVCLDGPSDGLHPIT